MDVEWSKKWQECRGARREAVQESVGGYRSQPDLHFTVCSRVRISGLPVIWSLVPSSLQQTNNYSMWWE